MSTVCHLILERRRQGTQTERLVVYKGLRNRVVICQNLNLVSGMPNSKFCSLFITAYSLHISHVVEKTSEVKLTPNKLGSGLGTCWLCMILPTICTITINKHKKLKLLSHLFELPFFLFKVFNSSKLTTNFVDRELGIWTDLVSIWQGKPSPGYEKLFKKINFCKIMNKKA